MELNPPCVRELLSNFLFFKKLLCVAFMCSLAFTSWSDQTDGLSETQAQSLSRDDFERLSYREKRR